MRMRKRLVATGLITILTLGPATVAEASVGDAPAPAEAPASSSSGTSSDSSSGAWGLLGLVGVAGLLGLRRRRGAAEDPEGRRSFGEAMTTSTTV